jgi:hypothetical protein
MKPNLTACVAARSKGPQMENERLWALIIVMMGAAVLSGCGGTSNPQERQLVSISVQPGNAQAVAPDGTIAFSAVGNFNQAPLTQPNFAVQWSSSDSNVATVDTATGLATCATVGGPVTIVGSAPGKAGTVTGSGVLTCQLSPNPVVKLSTPSVGVICQDIGFPSGCECTYTPGNTINGDLVTVTNVGGAPLDIGMIALKDGTAGFSQTNNCSATLDTGQSCDIVVVYTPLSATSMGPAKSFDQVIVSNNSTDSPQSVSLGATSFCVFP